MASVTDAPARRQGGALTWTGRVLSGLVVAFLVFDGAIKLAPLAVVTETVVQLGSPADPGLWRFLGALLIGIALLYAHPRTALLGAVLITGFLGGAVATHLRIGSPLPTHTLFGIYVGLIAWAGLWLREPRLRALLPVSRVP